MIRRLIAIAIAVGVAAAAGVTAGADSSTARVDKQLYSTQVPSAGDPCAGTQDVCVTAVAGQVLAQAYLHIDLSLLDEGASLDKLTLKLVPDTGNTVGTINGTGPALKACVVDGNLPKDSSGSFPLIDCAKASVAGAAQSDGSWQFDLTKLGHLWLTEFNTGAAIVPDLGSPTSTPAGDVSSPAELWSLAFLTTKTSAQLDFTPAESSDASVSPAQFFFVPQAPAFLPEVVPPPAEASPPAAPSPPAATAFPAVIAPVYREAVLIRHQWLLGTLALLALAVGLLAGAAVRNLRAEGSISLAAGARALVRARSQMAATVGLLLLAVLVSLGAIGQLTLVRVAP